MKTSWHYIIALIDTLKIRKSIRVYNYQCFYIILGPKPIMKENFKEYFIFRGEKWGRAEWGLQTGGTVERNIQLLLNVTKKLYSITITFPQIRYGKINLRNACVNSKKGFLKVIYQKHAKNQADYHSNDVSHLSISHLCSVVESGYSVNSISERKNKREKRA